MTPPSRGKKLGSVTFVVDERISREKQSLLARTVNAIRPFVDLKMEAGSITETELVKKLEVEQPSLVLVPWYRYLAWSRVEALYGLTRTTGPTFAGYFCEPIAPYELGEHADHLRTILFDFGSTTPAEVVLLIKSLIIDTRRAGMKPLLENGTPIYTEAWFSGTGLGTRMDSVLGLQEVSNNLDWKKRAASIRICLSSLWSLVYEEGPGKSDFHQAITASSPKAYFQVGADRRCLVMRLCYTMPIWGPKETLSAFWPKSDKPNSAAQLLLRHADFVRVHRIPENNDIEVVAGFLASAPAERAPDSVHGIWVEPLAASLVMEMPFQAPGPGVPQLTLLPNSPGVEQMQVRQRAKEQEKTTSEIGDKILELKRELAERDALIRDLRAGGVGTALPLPPPDAEALLDAFQEKYMEACFQISQFEKQITELETRKGSRLEIETLRNRMESLLAREQGWIKRIAAALDYYKTSVGTRVPRKKASGE